MNDVKITDDFMFLNGWGYVRQSSVLTIQEVWTDEKTEKEVYKLIITLSNGMILMGQASTSKWDDLKEPSLCDGSELEDACHIAALLDWHIISPIHYPG